MTNEQLKQQAIQEAYGEHWQEVKGFVDEDCSIPYEVALWYSPSKDTWDILTDGYYRPKSLSGIENNNGWIRIEADGSNLPTEEGLYKVIDASGNERDLYWYNNEPAMNVWVKKYGCTHYRPIVEHPKPVY